MVQEAAWPLQYAGDGVSVILDATDTGDLTVKINKFADRGRAGRSGVGELEQGLLAGLEYLDRGEHSSSTLDIETPEHLRFEPDPMKVTLPLMAFVTDLASVAMTGHEHDVATGVCGTRLPGRHGRPPHVPQGEAHPTAIRIVAGWAAVGRWNRRSCGRSSGAVCRRCPRHPARSTNR